MSVRSLNFFESAKRDRVLSRRAFIRTAAAGAAGMTLAGTWQGCAVAEELINPDPYKDLETFRYFGNFDIETRVAGENVFLEGPAVAPDGRVFFTNVTGSQILVWDPQWQELKVFRENSGMANGLMFDRAGLLLVCEGEPGRIARINIETGERDVLCDNYDGLPLEAPNDLFVDPNGRIYFSSRPGPAASHGSPIGVFRRDPAGAVSRILTEPDVHMPNGIVTSPDGNVLYLIDSDGGEDRNRNIKAFDLDAGGNISNERLVYDFYPGRSGDGMAVDAEGHLYVAAGLHALRGTGETLDTRPGIHVISPEGELLAFRETPIDTVTNCTFGGLDLKTLYVVCGNLLLSLPTEIPGASFYRADA